jgi:hypothetical protein
MRALLPAGVVTLILGAAVGQAGCEPQLTYVSKDHFAAEYAQALCTSLQPCCAENQVGYDYAACAAGWEAAVNALLDGPSASGNYDTTVATSCIAQVRAAQGASCQPGPGTLTAARATCQSIFAGEVPLGAPCTMASQCAQMDGSVIACAIVPGDAGAGGGGMLPLAEQGVSLQGLTVSPENVPICVMLPPDDAGMAMAAPCSIDTAAGTDTCTSVGMYCASTMTATMTTTMTCQPLAMAGGMCDPAVVGSCVPGNYCIPATAPMGGTCAPAGSVGSPCTAAAMCDSTGTCDVAGSQTCLAIKQPGQSCTADSSCSIGVCDPTTNTCLTNSIGTTAACNGVVSQ